jgi:long-chain acyl-CoA synthetase
LAEEVASEFSGYSGAVVVEGYGLSEAGPVTHAGPLDGNARPGTIGLPLPDTLARIVDLEDRSQVLGTGEVGQLLVRGPQVMRGYLDSPQATDQAIVDGWLATGDVASCDDDGFFTIVDRIKDLVITSGFNVYPAEVEEVLREFPAVADAAVIGVPDPLCGEVVKAVLTLRPGMKLVEEDLQSFLAGKLSKHKRPREIEVLEGDLPRNFLGKVLRRELRES